MYANLIPIIRSLVLSKCVEWCKTDLFPHEQIDKSPALLTFSHWTFYSCWIEPCIQSFGYSIMTFFCYLLDLDFISLPWSWFWSSFAMLFLLAILACSSYSDAIGAPQLIILQVSCLHHLCWILDHFFMTLTIYIESWVTVSWSCFLKIFIKLWLFRPLSTCRCLC